MDLTYDDILTEVKVFSRNYSQAHLTFSKWRSYKTKVIEAPESSYSIHEIEGKTYALIYRPHLFAIEAFQFESIVKRTIIKRNELLFKEIKNLWKLVNPFHLPGISKQVYTKFYEFLHFSVLNNNAQMEDMQSVLLVDTEIDFSSSEVQGFAQFYDTLFENIDAYARSMLVNEYCRTLKRLFLEIKASSWLKNLDLHNKHYSEGVKPSYPSWAGFHFKSRSIDTANLPIRNSLLTAIIPSRLTEKRSKKAKNTDLLDAKIKRMVSPWNGKDRSKYKTFSPQKTPEIKPRKTKTLSQPLGKIDNPTHPTGKKLKNFKDRKLIEDIVKDRNLKFEETKQRVLMTPLKFLF